MTANYRAALQEILTDRPVSYHRVYAVLLGGDVEAGVWLAQMIYWSGRGHDSDGWVTKKAVEMFDEIGISERGHERSHRIAAAAGVVETDRSTQGGLRRFRIKWDILLDAIAAAAEKDISLIPERAKATIRKGQKRLSRKDAQADSRKDKNDTSLNIDDNIDDNIDVARKKRARSKKQPAPQPPIYGDLFKAIADLCKLDPEHGRSAKSISDAAKFLAAKPGIKVEHVAKFGEWYYANVFVGTMGVPPKPSVIAESWRQFAEGVKMNASKPATNPEGRTDRNRELIARLEAERASEQAGAA